MGLGSSGGAAASPGQVVLNSLSLVWAHACCVADLGNASPGLISAWYRSRWSSPALYSELSQPFREILNGCFLPGLCSGRECCVTTPGMVEAGDRSSFRLGRWKKTFEKALFSLNYRSSPAFCLVVFFFSSPNWDGVGRFCSGLCIPMFKSTWAVWCLRTHFCFVIASCWDIAVGLGEN